ncbi:MAG: RtcB family protein [Spirochaetaceae bacterium]|jgi:RNA-splicing ligase RtcB|nr:RtcB family protein [Spirochaetaceae bacterium]
MLEIQGAYNYAKIWTDTLDEKSREQVELLCNQAFTAGSRLRLMPDVHAGAGCTIGTTMTITDKIVPNLVGVDIGCGMETLMLRAESPQAQNFEPALLDKIIHRQIPSGRNIRKTEHEYAEQIPFEQLRCPEANIARARRSIGTLGGGNHFIEANRDERGNLYIVIHSGSRHLGLEIANYYQQEAWKQLNKNRKDDIAALIQKLKDEGRDGEIQTEVKKLKEQIIVDIPESLAYTEGSLFDSYINDMKITQHFAELNRRAMMNVIREGLHISESDIQESWTTIHNYIDTDAMILRKGAVSARSGEKLLIPINMRDGSLVCEGLGNEDWNYSAPHGAGRIMSRGMAFKTLTLEDYKKSMEGIYSTTVNRRTLDESPAAYKTMDNIVANISPTAKILDIIKPVYNFKAEE